MTDTDNDVRPVESAACSITSLASQQGGYYQYKNNIT